MTFNRPFLNPSLLSDIFSYRHSAGSFMPVKSGSTVLMNISVQYSGMEKGGAIFITLPRFGKPGISFSYCLSCYRIFFSLFESWSISCFFQNEFLSNVAKWNEFMNISKNMNEINICSYSYCTIVFFIFRFISVHVMQSEITTNQIRQENSAQRQQSSNTFLTKYCLVEVE